MASTYRFFVIPTAQALLGWRLTPRYKAGIAEGSARPRRTEPDFYDRYLEGFGPMDRMKLTGRIMQAFRELAYERSAATGAAGRAADAGRKRMRVPHHTLHAVGVQELAPHYARHQAEIAVAAVEAFRRHLQAGGDPHAKVEITFTKTREPV